jgi:LAS superfamily LD-carboxypeptidase LdcB
MDYKTKKILLIGFFVFIWLFIAAYIYKETKPFQKEVIFETPNNVEYKQNENDFKPNTEETEELKLTADDFLPENFNNIETLEGVESKENQENIKNKKEVVSPENQNVILQEVAIIDDGKTFEKEEEQKGEIKMCGEFPCYTSEEFISIYNNFEKQSGLEYKQKYIYNNKQADDYIRSLAEKRGYQRRVFADESQLVWLEEKRTQKKVRDNYIAMRNEMKKENISLHFVSGYRDSSHQRKIFKNKMGNINISKVSSGIYDKKIDKTLEISSIPAYSKHHSGYAVDFGCGNDYLVYTFNETECYDWLSENNFENAKRFGFIPSYPDEVEKQGPNPEPWEFVWVGVETIKTSGFFH